MYVLSTIAVSLLTASGPGYFDAAIASMAGPSAVRGVAAGLVEAVHPPPGTAGGAEEEVQEDTEVEKDGDARAVANRAQATPVARRAAPPRPMRWWRGDEMVAVRWWRDAMVPWWRDGVTLAR